MKNILIIILLIIVMIFIFANNLNLNPFTIKDALTISPELIKSQSQRINLLESQVNNFLKKEEERVIQELKIKSLQNPEIINQELDVAGKIIIFEGEITYQDYIKEKGFLNKRELLLYLTYEYGIVMDLKDIMVSEFIEDVVILEIDKSKIYLNHIELKYNNSTVNGEKSLFATQFTPNEIKLYLELSKDQIVEEIVNDNIVFEKALNNLKMVLEELVLKLGYRKVLFEVI